jgi:hypothetical protein
VDVGLFHGGGVKRLALGLDHHPDRQVVGARELEVTLVVGRNAHDGAGPVLHQHVIGDPYRYALAVDGIHRIAIQKEPLARPLRRRPIQLGEARNFLPELRHGPFERRSFDEAID